MSTSNAQPPPILPVGTRVVTRVPTPPIGGGAACPAGMVAVVVAAPVDGDHTYRLRAADGQELRLRRPEIELLSHHQAGEMQMPGCAIDERGLADCVIYRCIVGSRAYGLEVDGSDTDRRGIYLPPATLQWSLYGAPEQLENTERQECYWELQKFIVLALKANPNILECLYTPLVEECKPLAEELRAMRGLFLSKLVYQTYNGYVLSQFQKMERSRRNQGEVKPKHAMHLIRLLLSGIVVLREGTVPVAVGTHRERLLAIRNGALPWAEVDAWRLRLHAEFDAAYARTALPDRPDYARANAFLVRARRAMVTSDE